MLSIAYLYATVVVVTGAIWTVGAASVVGVVLAALAALAWVTR